MTTIDKKKQKSVYKPIAPAVEQASRLLMLLGTQPDSSMNLTQICSALNIHKSKGYTILNTLMQYALITKDEETKTYSLGPSLLFLAQNVKDNLDIVKLAKPALKKLAGETRSCVLLGILNGDRVYIASKYENDEIMGISVRQYQSLHITHGAHGKAIFAFLDSKRRDELIKKNKLQFYGTDTPVDFKLLENELSSCRKHGYATDNGHMSHGINAVSSPVFSHGKQIIAVVILVGTFSENKFKEYGKKIAAIGKDLSAKMGSVL